MKRIFSASTASLLAALLPLQPAGPTAAEPCKPQPLAGCPEDGCPNSVDKGRNHRKNITSLSGTPELKTLGWMKDLDNPTGYHEGASRADIEALGEGNAITVVAYLVEVKKG